MTQPAESGAPCNPPCSMACLVTEGRHHTAESLQAAAMAELMADLPPRVIPPDTCPICDGRGVWMDEPCECITPPAPTATEAEGDTP